MIYHNTDSGLADLANEVELTVKELTQYSDEFDAISATGMSGVVVAAPVAVQMSKRLLVLRKEHDNCHGTPGTIIGESQLTGDIRALWIDDFISVGSTRKRVYAYTEQFNARCVEEAARIQPFASEPASITIVAEFLYGGMQYTRWAQ